LQQARNQPAFLFKEGSQEVFAIDFDVTAPRRQFLGALKSFLGFNRQPVEVHNRVLSCSW
jgi:hypothetical protein